MRMRVRPICEGRYSIEGCPGPVEEGDFFIEVAVNYLGNSSKPNGVYADLTVCRRTASGYTFGASTKNLHQELLLMKMPRFNRAKCAHLAGSIKDEMRNKMGPVWAALEELRSAFRKEECVR